MALRRQPNPERLHNGSFDFLHGSSCIDFLDALRLRRCNGLVTFGNALEEAAVGFFNPVAHEGQGGLPLKQAFGGDLVRNHEQQCQIRARIADGDVNDGFDHFQIELAPVALVGSGRIVKAIAHNNLSGGQRRTNDFADELRAAGVHQKQFRLGSHGFVFSAVLERVADFLADGRAARFANGADGMTLETQMLGQQRDLRRFAAAFGTFETDESRLRGIANDHEVSRMQSLRKICFGFRLRKLYLIPRFA